jgi:autotransporter-associated beta strand protein
VAIALSGVLNVASGTLTFANYHYDTLPGGHFEPRLTAAFACGQPLIVTNDAHYQLPKRSTTRLGSFNTNGTTQTFNAPISGDGSFRRSALAGLGGLTVLNATNTYTGHTLVDNGTLRVNGALSPVSLPVSSVVTVTNLGTLGGNGRILFPVVIENGGTLAPGASIGRLTISNSLNFAGGSTNLMELSKNGATFTNDSVIGLTSVTYGGTLMLANVGPTALAAGDSFKLFNATNYSGAFTNLVPATPGDGLAWDTSSLATNGTLKVVATANPLISNSALIGTNFVLSGTGGPANVTFYVLSSTIVDLPLTNWACIATNQFDANGSFTFTNPVSASVPQQFFVLRLP